MKRTFISHPAQLQYGINREIILNNIIEVKNLKFTYNKDKKSNLILKDVNLEIGKGEFVCVLGHNGSGKSTLAKHLNAILLPCGGSVSVCGIETTDEDKLFDIRKRVGMVFQNPDNQIISTVVDEDIAFALENLGVEHDEMVKRVDEALNLVDMMEYKHHAPHLLSGGQKQRVAIAGIIAMKPKCIVLDEPTAMLDPKGRKEVLSAIKKLNKETGVTVVLITHYMDEAVLSDRVLVMNDGEFIIDGTPQFVFQNVGLLKSIALDVPSSTMLMYKLRQRDIKVPLSVLTDDECVDVLQDLLEGKIDY